MSSSANLLTFTRISIASCVVIGRPYAFDQTSTVFSNSSSDTQAVVIGLSPEGPSRSVTDSSTGRDPAKVTLAAGDVLEVVVTVNAGTGTLGDGFFCRLVVNEDAA